METYEKNYLSGYFWNRREGGRHNFWKNDIVQGHNINQLESNGSRMADKSTSTRPWSSIYAHHNTSASQWHTQGRHDSSKANHQRPKAGTGPIPRTLCPFPKRAGIILPLVIVYEIIQWIKANHITFWCHTHPLQQPTLCGVCFSLNISTS